MPITIDGTGSISGLSAGGLPNGSITAPDLDGAQSGSAPIYAARAWVNFNGTGTVAIRASGNVSSITDNGSGLYQINFSTAMPDANYAISVSGRRTATNSFGTASVVNGGTYSTTAVQVIFYQGSNAVEDTDIFSAAIFR